MLLVTRTGHLLLEKSTINKNYVFSSYSTIEGVGISGQFGIIEETIKSNNYFNVPHVIEQYNDGQTVYFNGLSGFKLIWK